MVGPVFFQELLLGGRRNRLYVFRWIYAGWLVVELIAAALVFAFDRTPETQAVASWFVPMFAKQHFILLLLATPVITAGAITDEKTSGTLQYLLITDLNSFHIVTGKLLGRLTQVGALFLAGLPLFCFLGALQGVEPLAVLATCVVTFFWMLFLGSASLLASTLTRNTREAVLALFLVFGLMWLADWLSFGLLGSLDPVRVASLAWWSHASVEDARELQTRLTWFILAWTFLSCICLAVAAWQLRPTYVRQLEDSGRRRKVRWWQARRPELDDEPLFWKERYVEGFAPVESLRQFPRWIAMLLIVGVTCVSSIAILWAHRPQQAWFVLSEQTFDKLAREGVPERVVSKLRPITSLHIKTEQEFDTTLKRFLPDADVAAYQPALLNSARFDFTLANLPVVLAHFNGRDLVSGVMPSGDGFCIQAMTVLFLAALVAGVRCSGAISGEREKQTWEAMLLTPISESQLVRGKLHGILGAGHVYVLAYAVPAILLSILGGLWAVFWIVLWLAVTWLAMRFVGAAGIWCSGRSKSSWRSLLGTLGFGYVGGFIVVLLTSPATFILAAILFIFLSLFDHYLGTTTSTMFGGLGNYWLAFLIALCPIVAGAFYGLSWYFIRDTEKRIAVLERTRHWKYEPTFLRHHRPIGARAFPP